MMLHVVFYRPDLKTITPGYINASQVILIEDGCTADVGSGVAEKTTLVRVTGLLTPVFVVGEVDDIAAALEGVLERGRG